MSNDKIAELQARLDEANFWRKLKESDWPFSIDIKEAPKNIKESVVEILRELADSKIEELVNDGAKPNKPKKVAAPNEKEMKILEIAKQIEDKYKSEDRDETQRPTNKRHKQGEATRVERVDIKKGQKVTLMDIGNLRSVNKEHITEFVPEEKVVVRKIYKDKNTGENLADITKTSPAGAFRATVPVEDLLA